MMIRLHSQATTIPKIRAVLQASNELASLAKRYGISELTVSKWEKRDGVEDHSHIPLYTNS